MSRDMGFSTMWYVQQQRLKPACAYAQSDQSLCKSVEYYMTVKLLNKQHLGYLSLKGGCTGSSESTLVKNATLLEITCYGSNAFSYSVRKW